MYCLFLSKKSNFLAAASPFRPRSADGADSVGYVLRVWDGVQKTLSVPAAFDQEFMHGVESESTTQWCELRGIRCCLEEPFRPKFCFIHHLITLPSFQIHLTYVYLGETQLKNIIAALFHVMKVFLNIILGEKNISFHQSCTEPKKKYFRSWELNLESREKLKEKQPNNHQL